MLVEGDDDLAQLGGPLAAPLVRVQLEPDPTPLQNRPLDLVHALNPALQVAGGVHQALVALAGGHRPRPLDEPPRRLLQALDLLALRQEGLLLALQLQLAGDRVGGVVAWPDPDLSGVQRGDGSHRLVQQVAVVAHRQDAALEARHQPLEPLATLQVEVRLRLVEEQELRILDDRRRQADQLALPATEHAGR